MAYRSFTNAEKTDMVIIYGEVRRNARAAAALYAKRYPDRVAPREYQIRTLVNRLSTTGTFQPQQGGGRLLFISQLFLKKPYLVYSL